MLTSQKMGELKRRTVPEMQRQMNGLRSLLQFLSLTRKSFLILSLIISVMKDKEKYA